MIKDSGNRTEYGTGAVRDIQIGKGRCDLMPLSQLARVLHSPEIEAISNFKETGDVDYLYEALYAFVAERQFHNVATMALEVAKHFEEGANKYGENNWQKGIPVHAYMDSAIRHLLKFIASWNDEPHDRAFCWNILCAIWTVDNKIEQDDFSKKTAARCKKCKHESVGSDFPCNECCYQAAGTGFHNMFIRKEEVR